MSAKQKNPAANPQIVFREEFDDSAILFNPDTGKMCTLNTTGIIIWHHLDGTHSINDIIDKLHDRFDSIPENVNDQAADFIKDLIQKGFAA